VINVIADRAMLGAFSAELHTINPALIRQAGNEVYGQDNLHGSGKQTWYRLAGITVAAVALIGLASFAALQVTNNDVNVAAVGFDENGSYSNSANNTGETVSQLPETSVPIAQSTVGSTGRTLEQILRENPDQTTTRAAFKNLFNIWDIEYAPGTTRACEQARKSSLSCLFQRGSLTQIERLDRPVILTLQDDDGGVHQIVLATIDGTAANLQLGDELVAVPLTSVAQLWFGEYLLLWKPQIAEVKSFHPGMRDPDVAWIRESLATILGGTTEPEESDYFDKQLEAQVREYQIAKHLNADGLVGQQTQIAINSDLGVDAPRLIRAN
jgi:general secretion pathway protein A